MEGFTMARRSKQEYLRSIYDRYQHAPRAQKGTMPEEFCKVCGYNRKYAIWLLNRPLPEATVRKRGAPRSPTYNRAMVRIFGKGEGGLGVSVLPTSEGRPCTLVALDKATLRADPTVRGSAPGHQRPSDGSAPEGNQAHRETPTLWHHSARIATKADDPD